jgi:hypothetical protein
LDELKRAIAVLFQRKGKSTMTENDFVFSASIDMGWFTPKEAQKVMDISLKLRLLSKKNGELTANFDLDGINVPMEFKPSKKILDLEAEGPLLGIISRLKESGMERGELVARTNSLQKAYGIEIEAAALMLGNDLGIDVKEFMPLVREELFKRAKGGA